MRERLAAHCPTSIAVPTQSAVIRTHSAGPRPTKAAPCLTKCAGGWKLVGWRVGTAECTDDVFVVVFVQHDENAVFAALDGRCTRLVFYQGKFAERLPLLHHGNLLLDLDFFFHALLINHFPVERYPHPDAPLALH